MQPRAEVELALIMPRQGKGRMKFKFNPTKQNDYEKVNDDTDGCRIRHRS